MPLIGGCESWLRSEAARAACSNSGRSGKPVAKGEEWEVAVVVGAGGGVHCIEEAYRASINSWCDEPLQFYLPLGIHYLGPHFIALSLCSLLEVEMPASRNEAVERMLRSLQQLGYVGI